ncbi:MAG: serine/threonine protein kinase [Myxococcales bacterium]|nr:serine/threonine protein kinase [Myxococcales bacterium]
MAEVFLGSTIGAEGFSRRVAIKRVLPGFSDNPSFAQMFIAEAKISSRLVHPNIVSVVDFDRDAEQRLFLVMELVEGKDLDTLVSSGLLPIPVVIFVISEVLRGLGHAHDLPVGNDVRGVIHRDVSPHNVLLSWEGSVKVSDFGIAKAKSASEATASVFIKGKPAYMSPEQANGQSLDGRSDLFAVGIMLWEMLIGRRLFVGEDTRSTLAAVLFGQVPRPRSLRGDVPKDLERVVMKLLERDLPARYATAESAIQDLLECADAPKNGREALTRILAERFPQHAPVRQSLQRLRSSSGNTPPSAADRVTIPDGSAGQRPPSAAQAATAGAAPSLSSMMQARTGTLDQPAQPGLGKAAKIGMVAAITLASGVLAFGIVSALTSSKKSSQAPSAVVGSGGSGSAATLATVAPPDAAMAGVDAQVAQAPTPIDAGVAAGSASTHAVAAAEKRFGRLVVRAYPVLTVYLDNKKLGDTPIDIREPVGKHVVRLVNVDTNHDEKVTIEIKDSQPTTLERIP